MSNRETERRMRVQTEVSGAANALKSFESSLELPVQLTKEGGALAESAFQLVLINEGLPVSRQLCPYDELSIGRSPGCGLVLDDLGVSRLHARVSGGAIVDEGSANGMLVNGLPTKRHELEDGDVIGLGSYELVFHRAEGGVPEEATAPEPSEGVGHFALGEMTLRMGRQPAATQEVKVEVPSRGYLFLGGDTSSVQRKGVQMTVGRDTFVIGAAEGADLRLKAFRMPRVAALIVRGRSGYTLVPFARWPLKIELCGEPVTRSMPLEDKDRIGIGKLELIFRHGS